MVAFFTPMFPVQALSVNPAVHDVVVAPGKVETRVISIENDEPTTQTFVVSIQKFIPKGDHGQQEFIDASDTSGIPEWIFVDRPEVTLAAGQRTTLQVAIRVPENADGGGHYAALFLARKQASDEQVAMLPRIGILFFVDVEGPRTERLSVKSFTVDSSSANTDAPIGFRTVIANEGNVHAIPSGVVTIRNMFGSVVAKIRLNEEGARVLPSSERVLSSVWSKESMSFFTIGSYTATLTMENQGFGDHSEARVTFFVWPWRTVLLFFGIGIVLIVLYVGFKKIVIARATAKSRTPDIGI